MKHIKIGDLVRIMSEWTMHNPWMKLSEDDVRIGLVIGLGHGTRKNAIVQMLSGEVVVFHNHRLEVLNANR